MGLVPGVFALTAGIGDFVTGALAIPVAYFYYKKKPWSRQAAIVWNYVGLTELIILIPVGLLSSPSPIQTLALENPNLITSTWPSVLAPIFHVPLGILMHIYSLARLRGAEPARVKTTPQKLAWQLMLVGAISVTIYAGFFYIASPLLTTRPPAFQVYEGLAQILAAQSTALYIHIIPSMVALVLGPLQFHSGLRERYLNRHRWVGRTYLLSIIPGGLGAFYIAQFSFAGEGSRLGFSLQAILLLFFGYMAYTNIRRGRITTHREWMIRNYALIFAAVTLRIYIRIFFWMGLELPDFHAINAWLCWVPNLIVAEWIIHRSRAGGKAVKQVLPALKS